MSNTPTSVRTIVLAILFACSLGSCSSTPNGDIGYYPDLTSNGDFATIVLMGTNDIHGALLPQTLQSREESPTQSSSYEAGGLSSLAAYVKILRKKYGSQFLWLDAGDEWQGSIESNIWEGAPMIAGFNAAHLDAAAIGNHEFDYGSLDSEAFSTPSSNTSADSPTQQGDDVLGAMKQRLAEANYPYLSSNIFSRSTGEMPQWPNFYPSKILTVGNLKIGVIGLTTLETPKTTMPDYVQSLEFRSLKETTLKETQNLREQGAQIILVTAHVGLKCETGRMPPSHSMRKESDPQGPCGESDELVKLLNSLPRGTVDAVVAGHSHQIVHHYIAGVPVIQGGAFGRYFNLIYLTYHLKEKRIYPERTRIEGPIPVCTRVFKNQGDCNGDRPPPKEGRGKLVRARFRGELIENDPDLLSVSKPFLAKAEVKKNESIFKADKPIDANRFAESQLGNLVADSVRATLTTDFSIVNPGGIRSNLEAGPVTYGDIFRVLPFENSLAILKLTGKELKLLLEITQSGARGFYPTSGLSIKAEELTKDSGNSSVQQRDLNQNGVKEGWEVNRLRSVEIRDPHVATNTASTDLSVKVKPLSTKANLAKMAMLSKLNPEKFYTVGTIDFLVKGGDDFAWFMEKIPSNRISFQPNALLRDSFVQYVKKLTESGNFNISKNGSVNPERPRLLLEKPSSSRQGRKARSKRTRKKGH